MAVDRNGWGQVSFAIGRLDLLGFEIAQGQFFGSREWSLDCWPQHSGLQPLRPIGDSRVRYRARPVTAVRSWTHGITGSMHSLRVIPMRTHKKPLQKNNS